MRRATLLLFASVAVMLLATGVAVAANLYGTSGNDVIYGTTYADTIDGKGGADALYGKGDNDTLYGGEGNDNFLNKAVDSLGIEKTAGLRGSKGADKVYGQAGDDDLIGNDHNDTLDDISPLNINDWDRAFGGSGSDRINVADGDIRDEVSCNEDSTSTTDKAAGVKDTVTIDVDGESRSTITAADTVHQEDSNGDPVTCEEIKAKDRKTGKVFPVTYADLIKVNGTMVAAVEPA